MPRLAGWSQRHRWTALVLWIAALVAITAGSAAVGDDYRNDFGLPGTESQELVDAFEEHAPQQAGDTVTVVVQSDGGLQGSTEAVDALVTDLEQLGHVTAAQAPDPRGGTVSEDGTVGIATVVLDAPTGLVPTEAKRMVLDTAKEHESDDLRVELTGDAVREVAESEAAGGGAEGAGMLAALVILLFMFGSFLAASLPLLTAVLAVGTTFGIVGLLSHVAMIPDYTPPILMLVGLGVGIDYALLVFARYRSELLERGDRDRATVVALDTAGRSVLFAGATVVIALLGLFTLRLGSLQGVALAVTLTVLMTMLASLTLLPALLTVLGPRLEKRIRRHAGKRSGEPGHRWRAWADVVQRRPWPALLAAMAALAALCVPALSMQLGLADAGNDHPTTTSRQAYDLITEGFGPGANGPVVVVSPDARTAEEVGGRLARTDGVAEATPAQATPDGALHTSLAFPTTSPQSEDTADLVHRLRADLPDGVLVGGPTAAVVDFADAVGDRFPLFVGVVVGLSALLLLIVFRSVAIAVKAAVLNLVSIGAALGVVVLVFQDGRFGAQPGPIEAFVPVMIFAIVFGLSMDYEVFLVSRMHEEWRRGSDAWHAVREGLATTGGVITAAAAVMVVVFGSFVLAPDRMLQQFGLGLATAVLLDALVIRSLVVPAVLRLLGDRAWWAPPWLERRLPTVDIEPAETPAAREQPAGRPA